MTYTEQDIKDALKGVQDPDLKRDLVELNMIRDIKIGDGSVELTVWLTTPACPLKDKIGGDVKAAIKERLSLETTVNFDADTTPMQTQSDLIPGVRNVVFVASGKGGVGKSTVAANLALSLSESGARVGLMDGDIYGPSIPTMFGIHEQPVATDDKRIIPHSKFGLKLMSMGFLLEEGQPVIWRGPMLDSALRQFLGQVDWGELDYLIVDLPPGTGDVQLSLSKMAPQGVAVVVTTPQDVALADVKRAIGMFGTVQIKVLGVVENMSGFVCSHCGERTDIFGAGAGKRAADKYAITYFGEVPLTEQVVAAGDSGTPVIKSHPDDASSTALRDVSSRIAQQIAIHANAGQPATA
jgi:ATP-binding protein involved in chromosome partitioning